MFVLYDGQTVIAVASRPQQCLDAWNPLPCTAVEPGTSNGRQRPGNPPQPAAEPRREALRVHLLTQAFRPHLASPRPSRSPTTATCCLRPSQTQPQQAAQSTWAQPPRLPARAAQSPGTARATRGSCDTFCSVRSFMLFPLSCGCAQMLEGGSPFSAWLTSASLVFRPVYK